MIYEPIDDRYFIAFLDLLDPFWRIRDVVWWHFNYHLTKAYKTGNWTPPVNY